MAVTATELMERWNRAEKARHKIGWSQMGTAERIGMSMAQYSKAKTGRFELLLSDLEWLDTLASLHEANPRPIPSNRTMVSDLGGFSDDDNMGAGMMAISKIVSDLVEIRKTAVADAGSDGERDGALWAISAMASKLGILPEYQAAVTVATTPMLVQAPWQSSAAFQG